VAIKGETPANTKTGGSKPEAKASAKSEQLVKVSDTGQVVYQAKKQAYRAFPDPKGGGTRVRVKRKKAEATASDESSSETVSLLRQRLTAARHGRC